jgi:long-chain acyl-CoA synthetase
MRGPSLFQGYWRDPEATAAALTSDGWYRTGDIGRFDATGHLVLMGRTKDIIVLPNGLNVYPEDIENALRTAGLRDSVVVETRPGRIEAVVLAPGSHNLPQGGDIPAQPAVTDDAPAPEETRRLIADSVKRANATLAAHQRVEGWRVWPDSDFPRTHTLKVKRDEVRRWAVVDAPLPVQEDPRPVAV